MALSRRHFLLGSAVLTASWVTWGVAAGPAPATADSATFMRVSGLLVNHQLHPGVGARIAQAAAKHADSDKMMNAIISIAAAKGATEVEAFFADIPEGPLQDFARWIIFAWYTGCSSPKKDAQVFAYEEALTYRTTADVVAIPSYGVSGPNLWSRAIAPLSPMPHF